MADIANRHFADYHPSRADGLLPRLMIIGDHASNHVPDDIDLGIDPAILQTHRAVDLGTKSLGEQLNTQQGCAVANATISRLVVDFNRFRDESSTIAAMSDGVDIPGNALSPEQYEARLAHYYDGYHKQISALVAQEKPQLIIFLHSFTPRLSATNEARPWHFGIMYDQDVRAGLSALNYFDKTQFLAGDQLPYSGKIYNSSFGRHAEANAIAYLGLEIRQDLLAEPHQISDMAQVVTEMSEHILRHL